MATGIVLERLKQEYGTAQPEAFLPYALCYRTKTDARNGRQMDGLKKYAAHYGIPETEIPEQMTRSEASRLLDRWIAVHGRMPRIKHLLFPQAWRRWRSVWGFQCSRGDEKTVKCVGIPGV